MYRIWLVSSLTTTWAAIAQTMSSAAQRAGSVGLCYALVITRDSSGFPVLRVTAKFGFVSWKNFFSLLLFAWLVKIGSLLCHMWVPRNPISPTLKARRLLW